MFLRALTVFCWVPLSCGCTPSIPAYHGGVSVLLQVLLHAFSWVYLLSRCYIVLLGRCYMNAKFSDTLFKWSFLLANLRFEH
jgi:hypothetical protein